MGALREGGDYRRTSERVNASLGESRRGGFPRPAAPRVAEPLAPRNRIHEHLRNAENLANLDYLPPGGFVERNAAGDGDARAPRRRQEPR